MNEKKADLIAQLLAKAESTTPEEAEALTAAAERMMVKYMIDQATIDERRAKKGQAAEKIVEIRLDFTGAYRIELVNLSASVIYGLGSLRALQYTGNPRQASVWVIGFESDATQAAALIRSLHVQSMVALRQWWNENREDYRYETAYLKGRARESFIRGFGAGAGKRIRENRRTIISEAGTGTDLVLASRDARVQSYLNEKNTRRGRSRSATAGGASFAGGYIAGQQANTGERQMTQGRGIER